MEQEDAADESSRDASSPREDGFVSSFIEVGEDQERPMHEGLQVGDESPAVESSASADLLERTIRRMQQTSVCSHPTHAHSFQQVHFLLFRSCLVCGKRLPLYASSSHSSPSSSSSSPGETSSSNAVVKCVACGAVAHRACTTLYRLDSELCRTIPICPVNHNARSAKESVSASLAGVCPSLDGPSDGSHDPILISEQSVPSASHDLEVSSHVALVSDPEEDGQAHQVGAGTDNNAEWKRVKSRRRGGGLAPGVISTIAFPENRHRGSYRSLSSTSIQPSTGAVGASPIDVVVPCGLDSLDSVNDVEVYDDNDEDNDTVQVTPLHYANHPFASISRALQENVLAVHSKLRAISSNSNDNSNGSETTNITTTTTTSGSSNINSVLISAPFHEKKALLHSHQSSSDDAALSQKEFVPCTNLLGTGTAETTANPSKSDDTSVQLPPILPQQQQRNSHQRQHPFVQLASQTLEMVKSSVSSPAAATAAVVTAGGAIAGGVAGLVLAGPAGAYAGSLGGATALGVILEGGVSIGVFVGSVAMGGYTASQVNASHLQHRHRRVLTMGEEGTARKVLLVRPELPDMDPIWEVICHEARRNAPDAASQSPFPSLIFRKHNVHEVILERYRRDADILHNTEEEVPTKDKVLLLVSRMLSDKASVPGFVYRYMMDAFLDRDRERQERSKQPSGGPFNAGQSPVSNPSPRIRRDDVHAVIRYVTATVLESRPGLCATAELTELTATAVEALVFGRLYDMVFEEIIQETYANDTSLRGKIRRFHEVATNEKDSVNSARRLLLVSEGALEALHLIPKAHSAADKLFFCVLFLERISDFYLETTRRQRDLNDGFSSSSGVCADSLLKLTCHHIIAARLAAINAEVAFLEEFARDEQLLRGREGYALVTLQASLHFLNLSDNLTEIFDQNDDEDNVPVTSSSSSSSDSSLSPRASVLSGDD
jgi:hypothetical protein